MMGVMRKHVVAAVLTSGVLSVGGVAFAFDTAGPTTTAESSDSSTVVSDGSTVSEAPEAPDTESSDESEATNDERTDNTLSDDESSDDDSSEEGTHPDNHGAAVSEAAHSCPPGPEHGKCVSAVAHEGKDSTDGGTDGEGTTHGKGKDKGKDR